MPGQWADRKIAVLVKMIHTAQSIHQSVVNIPVNISLESGKEVGQTL